MKKIDICVSDDYACVEFGDYSFYYGYEELWPDPDTSNLPEDFEDFEWAFVAARNKEPLMVLSTSKLCSLTTLSRNTYTPEEFLLAGIAVFMEAKLN